MLGLAASAADGAFPYLVPVEYVTTARRLLDREAALAGRPRPALIVSLACLVQPDADAARTTARSYLDRYLRLPNYLANLRGCGFTNDELTHPGADRVVDALVAWGDEASVRARLRATLDAGADQVAMIPLTADGTHADLATMEALAPPW